MRRLVFSLVLSVTLLVMTAASERLIIAQARPAAPSLLIRND